MEYYELHPDNPQERYINKAIEVLKGLVPEAMLGNQLKNKKVKVGRKHEQMKLLKLNRNEITDIRKLLHSTH